MAAECCRDACRGGGLFPDSSVPTRQAGLGQDQSPALPAMAQAANQLFFAETPEGGKRRTPWPGT